MQRLLFFITLCGFNLLTNAQNFEQINKNLEDTWVGTIVFNDDTELTCQFTYNPLTIDGILLVKTDSTNHAFSVNVVRSFSFYDDEINKRRYFYALPVRDNITRKYFFELLYDSKDISVLSRNTIKVKDGFADIPNIKKHVMKFLLDHRDRTVYSLSRSEILRMTDDKKDEINAFIKQKQIFFYHNKVEDYISIVEYYSSLKTHP